MRLSVSPAIRTMLWTALAALTLAASASAQAAQAGSAGPQTKSAAAAQPATPGRSGTGAKAPARPATGREAELRARVLAYWQRRQAKDLGGMYEFYSAEYRQKVTRDAFIAQTRLIRYPLTDARVSRTTIEGNRAVVAVTFNFLQPTISPTPLEQTVEDTWIRENNQWRKLDEPLVLPFPTGLTTPPGPPEPGDQPPPQPSNQPEVVLTSPPSATVSPEGPPPASGR